MLKLKLQYFGHLMCTDNSLEKSLMPGKIEDSRNRGHQKVGRGGQGREVISLGYFKTLVIGAGWSRIGTHFM